MTFLLSDTFTDSLAKLMGEEQKAAKTTAFDLQLNPANPGLSFHRVDKARDKNFWSVRVNSDIRIIVHKTAASLMLCYVDHHDKAYQWAERRKLETHPQTGAAQWVEIKETVREIVRTKVVEPPKPRLFGEVSDSQLLSYGVPQEWLNDVREANEDTLLTLADHLPKEAAEALLELATGEKPAAIPQVEAKSKTPIGTTGFLGFITRPDPFKHPDAQRRFRIMGDVKELEQALSYPWEKWAVFLHPAQREGVEADYSGPARVSGSAGTGKTVVALHRAVFLARRNPDARVLLATFSITLANALMGKLRGLISHQPHIAERLEVVAINAVGKRLYESQFGRPRLASPEMIQTLMAEAAAKVADHKFSAHFLVSEWESVVDAWQLDSWEAYRDVLRLGRKTRLPEKQRALLWSIFDAVRSKLKANGVVTQAGLFHQLTTFYAEKKNSPFEFIVVDEAQDLGVAQLRFLAALGAHRSDGLFFAGDLGQRIFQQPFSWKALGVDIRGRSTTLHINYRTSHQIRRHSDRLLGPELSDVDGNTEERKGTISVFNGPPPALRVLAGSDEEEKAVAAWLSERVEEGVKPHEIGVFVRSPKELDRARAAVKRAGLSFKVLDENVESSEGQVSISTMHLAKGLEFRAVAVMACDDEVIPLQERIAAVTEDSDLEEVYNTERHLLYVACTRARDHLLVTGVTPASEFMEDLNSSRSA